MTTEADEFNAALEKITIPGKFDSMGAADKSRWIVALRQAFEAGRQHERTQQLLESIYARDRREREEIDRDN